MRTEFLRPPSPGESSAGAGGKTYGSSPLTCLGRKEWLPWVEGGSNNLVLLRSSKLCRKSEIFEFSNGSQKCKKSEKVTSWALLGAAQTLNGRSDLKIRAFWTRPPLQSIVNTIRNRCFSVWHRFHFWLNFVSFLRHIWWPSGPKEQSKLKKRPTKKCGKNHNMLY